MTIPQVCLWPQVRIRCGPNGDGDARQIAQSESNSELLLEHLQHPLGLVAEERRLLRPRLRLLGEPVSRVESIAHLLLAVSEHCLDAQS